MQKHGCKQDVYTFDHLIHALYKKRDVRAIVRFFREMYTKSISPNESICSSMLDISIKKEYKCLGELLPIFDTREYGLSNEGRLLSFSNLKESPK